MRTKVANNSPKKVTAFMYSMANFGKEFTESEIKNALECVQVSDLKKPKNRGKNDAPF